MAETVGDIAIRVGADITELKKGFADASDSVGKFASKAGAQLRSSTNDIVKMGAAAAAAGAAVLTALYVDAAKSIDAQAKLAQALNGTIGGLRAAEMAAGDAGVSSDELNNSLVKLNQRLGEAERGSGAAYDALNAMGLSAKSLSGLDVDQKLTVIADRVKSLGLSSSQTAVLMKDLGIRNENLANLMRQGGDAIREQSQEVKDLGLNLSAVDAAKIEMANDALGIFGDVLTGIQDQIAVTAAPYITVLSEKFREAAIESGGFKNIIKSVIDTALSGFGKVGDVIQGLRVVIKGVELILVSFKGAVITLAEIVASSFTMMYDSAAQNVNFIIEKINSITGSEIEKVGTISDSQFMTELRQMGSEARDQVIQVRSEMHNLAMQEMPSDRIKDFMKEVEEASTKAAEATVQARAAVGGNDSVSTSKTDKKKEEDLLKKQEAELEAIKNRYITEEELERQHREEMAIIGEEFDAAKFETEEQWRSIREQAEAEHLARMTDLNRSAYEGIQNILESKWGSAVASTAGAMKSMLGTMATGSRKAFEASKAWAMADALISTYQGIAAGVKLGWPLAIPAVAWAAATGFAQVSAIKNQSFGGAGGAAASGAGTPATAPNPIGVGGQASGGGGGGGNQTLTVAPIDPGAIFSGSAMQSFGERIYNFSKDGGKVVFAQ